ncbi:MAG: DUF2298 domain-containing protein [Chloroflexota bacterium]
MIDTIRWLLMLEVIGLAFLPLTVWLFRWLPDRGYAFAKIAGLLVVTYLTWLAGNAAPVAGPATLPALLVLIVAAVSWWFWRDLTLEAIREARRVIVVEELLFLGAFIAWTVLRAMVFHPGISHTEQYMDMSFLNSSLRSASYPPYDPWMSGHAINYYYFGYLMFATAIKLAGVVPAIGYNLALSTLFALTVAGAFSIAYAMTRRLWWSLLAPVFLALLGNWHAVLVQLPAGHFPSAANWFWESTRVVGNGNTINEFPFFSFMLGDLHPHVMALPVGLLVIAGALSILLNPGTLRIGRNANTARLALVALFAGSLYAINSWDFPTYLIVVLAMLAGNAYLTDASPRWWKAPLASAPATAFVGVILFSPFYLKFASPAQGLGWVTTPANPGEFLQVFGLFLLAAVLLFGTYALIFQPSDEATERNESVLKPERHAMEAGAARPLDNYLLLGAVALIAIVFGVRFQQWTLILCLLVAAAAVILLQRIVNSEEPHRGDVAALIFILLSSLVLAGTEVVYLRDVYAGGSAYRLNTVFKFYYQAWILLGLAGAYAAFRVFTLVRKHFERYYAYGAMVLLGAGIAMGAVYTIKAPQSMSWGGTATSLNGMSALVASSPSDAAAITWLRTRVHGNPVELEAATASAYYPQFARVATFSGLPTVMGWGDHEVLWRGTDPEIQARLKDVNTIYTTSSVRMARTLLSKYHVRYVFAGDTEHAISGVNLAKFGTFMKVAFRSGSTTVYTW